MKKIKILVLMTLMAVYANAQYSIQGNVSNLNGEPLVGASIQLEGTQYGTVTNLEGKYVITNIKAGDYNLLVSHIGFGTTKISIQVQSNVTKNITLENTAYLTDEVIVSSLRTGSEASGSMSKVKKEDIANQNMGQDIPYLLSLTPSIVTTSDAGAGVGYTGFRIRGSDANRINVTVNGIPMNDAESHGVWWVNMPDFASSVDNIQVQRGVGTSTNGSGAFGGSINIQTNKLEKKAYAEISSAAGSFDTYKNTMKVGSGLLNDHFTFDARLSKITSEGFIDRAASNLQSYFLSGAYYSENTLVKINVFSGMEKTYQSWNGVPKVRLEDDLEGMQRYADHWLLSDDETKAMINSDSRTYNLYTYDNETDNYQQDHFQLFFSQNITSNITFNSALHYTYGRGYYEQYKVDDDLADYGINDIVLSTQTITSSDIVRQKWLNNDFYGVVASVNLKNNIIDASIGGAANEYDGAHYGKVIWGQFLGDSEKGKEYYRNNGNKTDYNIYTKAKIKVHEIISVYGDLQYRGIKHSIIGIDDDGRDLTQSHTFNFINPKAGITLSPNKNHEAYIFYARGNREPNRSNFTDADSIEVSPKAESMNDFEMGYTFKEKYYSIGANAYYMDYKDQLILTGEINDVGSPIMTNVDKSYRMGIEFIAGAKYNDLVKIDANLTLSENKIKNFTEYVDNWDTWGQEATEIKNTDIAFSPNIIGNIKLLVTPLKGLNVTIQEQYVGEQFIDNTSSNERMLDAYAVTNLSISYAIPQKIVKEARFTLRVNNLLNNEYETNAWVYSYIYDDGINGQQRYAMDGYFPQAGINFMVGLNLKF